MKSLRNSIRKAVLAVPLATTACLGASQATGSSLSVAGTTSSGSTTATSTVGTSGFGGNVCASCAAQGLVCNPYQTGCISLDTTASTSGSGGTPQGSGGTTGTTGGSPVGASTSGSGSSGSSGSSGDDCPSFGLCSPLCDCVTSVFPVAPLMSTLPTDGIVGHCHCIESCPPVADGGMGVSHVTGCSAAIADAGAPDGGGLWDLTCYYYTTCNGGRRPRGLVESPPAARSTLGAYFAQLAHLEAASVLAFRRMARQLRSLGAPTLLVAHARRAAREEVRHTRLTRRLAARFGGVPNAVEAAATEATSIEELALENAREGCVGETFGAAIAAWQSRHAADPEVRAVAEALREDELEHAELAWAVDAWAQKHLNSEGRARVAQAKEDAIQGLESSPGQAMRVLEHVAGLPMGAEHLRLLASLRAEVWMPAPV